MNHLSEEAINHIKNAKGKVVELSYFCYSHSWDEDDCERSNFGEERSSGILERFLAYESDEKVYPAFLILDSKCSQNNFGEGKTVFAYGYNENFSSWSESLSSVKLLTKIVFDGKELWNLNLQQISCPGSLGIVQGNLRRIGGYIQCSVKDESLADKIYRDSNTCVGEYMKTPELTATDYSELEKVLVKIL